MPVLVTSKFEQDPIKIERASPPFSHYKYGKFFRRSRALNSVGSGPICWIRTCPRFYALSWLHASLKKKSDKKQQRKGGDIVFPIISQWALSVAMETRVYPICPRTLWNLSPTLMMLHIKFNQHWPTGLRDIQVSSELWQNDRTTEFWKDKANPVQPPLFQSGAIIKSGYCPSLFGQ